MDKTYRNRMWQSTRKLRLWFLLAVAVFCLLPLTRLHAEAQEKERKKTEIPFAVPGEGDIEAVADDLEYVRQESKVIGRGNVVVTHKDIRLLADQAEVYTDTKKAFAEGHVTLIRNGTSISGDKGFYDFAKNQGSFPHGRIVEPPFYVRGEQIEQVSKYQINIYQASVTTCPLPHEHYDVKANRAVLYPGDKLVAWNVVFRILKFPVFWWPYLVIPLDQETGPFELTFGQSENYGNYILAGKTFSVIPSAPGRELKTKFHANYYKKRGLGLGNQTWYHFDKIGDGELKLFNIKDERAPDPFYFKEDGSWREKARHRVTWKHRTDFDEYTNLIGQYNEFSDPYVLSNYFMREFDEEPIPQTFLTFTRNARNYGILVDIQRQANDFDNVLERLPEIRFDLKNTEIKNTGFYYDSQTSYVNYHQVGHTNTADPEDDEGKRKIVAETSSHASRVNTFHEISYPKRFFRYYDFTPKANAEWTYYNHNAAGQNHKVRNAAGLGAELSTRFFRFFEVPKGSVLGISADRIRHMVRPIITYTGVRHVSMRPEHLLHFDGLDSLNVSDVIRAGVENRLQTKTQGRRIDILSLNTYANYEFNDDNNDTRWKTADVEVILRPYPWLQLRSDIDIDLKQHRRTANDTDIVVSTKYADLKLNHRYVLTTKESLESDKYFQRETNVVTFEGTTRLNNRWTMGGYVRWEVKRHSFREYEWHVSRDLHDWIFTLGQNIQHTEVNWLNHEIFFELQLKAIPGTTFASGSRASFPEARIGETVSGSNVAPPPPSLLAD